MKEIEKLEYKPKQTKIFRWDRPFAWSELSNYCELFMPWIHLPRPVGTQVPQVPREELEALLYEPVQARPLLCLALILSVGLTSITFFVVDPIMYYILPAFSSQ